MKINKPTVIDVAKEANVALGTVSRVLNNPGQVAVETRNRVLEAIERLDYQPLRRRNNSEKSPRSSTPVKRRRGCIGVLLLGMDDSLTHLPVINEAIYGVELAVAEADESLMLANVADGKRVPAILSKKQVDGLIIKSPLLGDLRECVSPALVDAIESLPHVWLIGQPRSAKGDVVTTDNEAGARLAADYLAEKGHTRIGYMHPRPGQRRSEGLKSEFRSYASSIGMSLEVFEGDPIEKVRWPLSAITKPTDLHPLIDCWEAMPKNVRPTAMIVPADSIAVQLYAALDQRGLEVGKDLSVLSVNHEKPLVIGLRPSLTTLDIQPVLIGRQAHEQLISRIEKAEEKYTARILIAPKLVVGESVAQIE